jgi:Ca-activated chloride channel family protein
VAAFAAVALLPTVAAHGGGVLVPTSLGDTPDPAALALRSMDVHVTVDGPHGEVRVEQIWENRTDAPLEGRYEFALAPGAALEGFSLWNGDERLHGVVIEKSHGKRLYEDLKAQAMDPGLAETGDRDSGEEGVIVLRVAPVPAHGTTRVQLTYDQPVESSGGKAQLVVPLGPGKHAVQPVGTLRMTVDVSSPIPLASVDASGKGWAWKTLAPGRSFAGVWKGQNVALKDDLTVRLAQAPLAGASATDVYAYRDPHPPRDVSPFAVAPAAGAAPAAEAGFFLARTVLAPAPRAAATPRDLVFVLDASPSMQWDKLEVAFAALEYALGQRLGKDDRFGVVLFNDEVRTWKAELVPASAANVAAALDCVRASYLAGGSDLAAGVAAGAELLGAAPRAGADLDLVLLTDGRPTWGEVAQKPLGMKILAAVAAVRGARLFALGIGEDGDDLLLASLTSPSGGAYTRLVRLGAEGDVARTAFFDRLGGRAVAGLTLTLPPAARASSIYGAPQAWDGGEALFVGRYAAPLATPANATLAGRDAAGAARSYSFPVALPAADTTHPWVGRWWATLRVRDLLDRIRLDGERADWITEIITLAKRFGLVTPYTSFIAAPRALLRPRNFQAGDPVLRVKTGAGIRGVVAIFPWGLVKPLERVPDEDVWETRFLAPAWTKDGSYACTLVLTDERGRKLREDKRFTIDSTPPALTVELAHGVVHPGERLRLLAHADADVRRISARLGDGAAVDVRWSGGDKASVAELQVPEDAPAGEVVVHVVAEDFARNTTVTSQAITVVR